MATAEALLGLGMPPGLARRAGFTVQSVTTSASTQGSTGGLVLGENVIVLATPASGDGAVTLPSGAGVGSMCIVVNMHASNSLDLFPHVGGSIIKLATDGGTPVATGASAICVKLSTTQWMVAMTATPAAT